MKILFLALMLFSSLLYSPKAYAKDDNKSEDSTTDEAFIYTGVGIVAVGGAGSIIIAHNNKKKKDEPSDEIKASDRKDIE